MDDRTASKTAIVIGALVGLGLCIAFALAQPVPPPPIPVSPQLPDVKGPASSINNECAKFSGTTGKNIVGFGAPCTPAPTPGQIVGTSTNDNASAGNVGELFSSTVLTGSAISPATTVGANITSISPSAGDWDIWGSCVYKGNAATTVAYTQCSVSSVSATINDTPGNSIKTYMANGTPFGSITEISVNVPMIRISLSATTQYFLITNSSYAVNTMSAFGAINARRRR